VYAQIRELSREGFVTELPKHPTTRGRPRIAADDSSAGTLQEQQQRRRSRYIIEETRGVYDVNTGAGEKKKVIPPGNVVYSNDFLYLWNKLVAKEVKMIGY
jgi:hypothetical protein